MESVVEMIQNAMIVLVMRCPFYYEIMRTFNIVESNLIQTMGVGLRGYKIQFTYNPEFIKTLSPTELIYVFVHEVMHVLSVHTGSRSDNLDKQLANMAMDMVINENINSFYIRNNSAFITQPKVGTFLPKEYTGELIFEAVYDWLKQNPQNNPTNGKGEPSKFDEVPELSEAEMEIMEQVVKELVESAKARGLVGANEEKFLNDLKKHKRNIFKEIRSSISSMRGNRKEKTWFKPNRKGYLTKGNKKVQSEYNIILDTSGSMDGLLEPAFSLLFREGYVFNLIQCDTEVKEIKKINKTRDLKQVIIKGLGGTMLQPAIDKIIELKMNKNSTIIITDGCCDTLDVSGLLRTLIVTVGGDKTPVSTGTYKEIIISEAELKEINDGK